MNIVCKKEDCTGCNACFNICNHSAITMQSDEEGFLHPIIDQGLCVDCGLCVKVCPVINKIVKHDLPKKVYSGWSKSEHIRLQSASGGAFTEIASYFIKEKKAVVFGVAMNDHLQAVHTYIEHKEELPKLQGSKYVQSNVGTSLRDVRHFLRNGRVVLFSGTPCQIAGLRNFLHRDYDNLYTIDLICHGVPSPKLLEDYKNYISERIGEPIRDIYFRNKKSSWIFFNMAINSHIEGQGAKSYDYEGSYYADPFIRGFLRDNAIRPNCYHCSYTDTHRVSDFTLADWWGYKATSEKDKGFEHKGVSLIMCNTRKAVDVINKLNLDIRERNIEEAMNTNLSLKQPFPMPDTRQQFWLDYGTLPFQAMVNKWMYPEPLSVSNYISIYYKSSFATNFLIRSFRLIEKILRKVDLPVMKIMAK